MLLQRIKHAILVHHGMGKNGTASKNLTDDERVVIKGVYCLSCNSEAINSIIIW